MLLIVAITWLGFGFVAWLLDAGWEMGFSFLSLVILVCVLLTGPVGAWYSLSLYMARKKGCDLWEN